jgi:zinc transport system permease protein
VTLPLPWPFERDYMQLALLAGLVIGATAPLIGTFLVQKRLSLLGDGLGHLAFAGVAIGIATGVWPVWTAMAVALAGALAIEWLRTRGRTAGDLALALFFYSGIAVGVVLMSHAHSLDASAIGYLFGQILVVSPADAWTIAAVGALVAAVVLACWRAFLSVVIDEEAARVGGLPVDRLNLLLAALVAVTVVAAMRVVGVLLVAALMVLPVGAAQRMAPSFRLTLVVASAIGAGSVVVGLAAARLWDLAAGGTIVLVAAAAFGLSSRVGRRPGPALGSRG